MSDFTDSLSLLVAAFAALRWPKKMGGVAGAAGVRFVAACAADGVAGPPTDRAPSPLAAGGTSRPPADRTPAARAA
eukprot:4194385-Prymnesium_polylepis.1